MNEVLNKADVINAIEKCRIIFHTEEMGSSLLEAAWEIGLGLGFCLFLMGKRVVCLHEDQILYIDTPLKKKQWVEGKVQDWRYASNIVSTEPNVQTRRWFTDQ